VQVLAGVLFLAVCAVVPHQLPGLFMAVWVVAGVLLEPEWVGVYIATYIALISTLGFSASINEVRKKAI